jgi:hypothetical protein
MYNINIYIYISYKERERKKTTYQNQINTTTCNSLPASLPLLLPLSIQAEKNPWPWLKNGVPMDP